MLLPVAILLVPEPMVLGAADPAPIPPELLPMLLPMLLLSELEEVAGAPDELDGEPDDEGGVVIGVEEELLDDGVVTTGVLVSSTFLPQAPSANKVERATAVRARGLKFEACMSDSFYFKTYGWVWLDTREASI